jgi:osmoprotectant transport system substrate-binding protein
MGIAKSIKAWGAAALVLTMSTATTAYAADSVTVASKIDTEGNLLGNIIAQVLKSHGIAVSDKIGLGTTPIVRKAITTGEIDIYPEYTGNAAFFFNKADDPLWKNAAKGYEEAAKLDYAANKIVWLTPAPANNTWAVGLLGTVAEGQQDQDLRRLRQVGIGGRSGQARGIGRVRQYRSRTAVVRKDLRIQAET